MSLPTDFGPDSGGRMKVKPSQNTKILKCIYSDIIFIGCLHSETYCVWKYC